MYTMGYRRNLFKGAGKIVCWGEVLWDLFPHPEGRRLGGAPANVAYHLATLNVPVTLVTRVGRDNLGDQAIKNLSEVGVDTSLVQRDKHLATGVVNIELREGEPHYQLVQDRAWQGIELTPRVAEALNKAPAVYFGTLSQRYSRHPHALTNGLRHVSPEALRVCDPNLRPGHVDIPVLRRSLDAANVVKLNEDEAVLVRERLQLNVDSATWLLSRGCRLIAVTHGRHGSAIFRSADRHEHPGFVATPGGDNVGAGDAFCAALIALMLANRTLSDINIGSNFYASFVASNRGATPEVPAAVVSGTLP